MQECPGQGKAKTRRTAYACVSPSILETKLRSLILGTMISGPVSIGSAISLQDLLYSVAMGYTRISLAFAAASLVFAQAPARRLLKIEDMHSFHTVADPQLSPDGAWVAYTV